jgi:hypothetical protein
MKRERKEDNDQEYKCEYCGDGGSREKVSKGEVESEASYNDPIRFQTKDKV